METCKTELSGCSVWISTESLNLQVLSSWALLGIDGSRNRVMARFGQKTGLYQRDQICFRYFLVCLSFKPLVDSEAYRSGVFVSRLTVLGKGSYALHLNVLGYKKPFIEQ